MKHKEYLESEAIVLHDFPKIGSDELIMIVANAKRGYSNPAVVKYKSSFVTLETGRDGMYNNFQKYAIAFVIIPSHRWTVEEPWGSDFKKRDFRVRPLLKSSMNFIDLAETFNYQMHEVAKQPGYNNLLKGIGQR